MEKDIVEEDLFDVMSGFTYELNSFFDLLTDVEGPHDSILIEKITEVCQSLLSEVDDRIDNLCRLIRTCLGDIGIEREHNRLHTLNRSPIIGVTFRPGPMVKRVDWQKKVGVGIRPERPTGRFTTQEKEALASVKAEARASEEIEREANLQENVAQ